MHLASCLSSKKKSHPTGTKFMPQHIVYATTYSWSAVEKTEVQDTVPNFCVATDGKNFEAEKSKKKNNTTITSKIFWYNSYTSLEQAHSFIQKKLWN